MDLKRLNQRRNSAIATAAIVVVMVVVIAAIGLGTYYALSRTTASSSTITTRTSSSTTTATSSSSSRATSSPTSSSTSAVTTTCTTTSTGLPSLNMAMFFGNFSEFATTAVVTANGTAESENVSYTVLGTSASGPITIYNVNLTLVSNLLNEVYNFQYASNATILSMTADGVSVPSYEYPSLSTLMFSFTFNYLGGSFFETIDSSPFLSQVNTTQVTLGPTTMTVTNYSPSSLPFTASFCGSVVATFTSFEFQVGKVAGTTFGPIATYLSLAGTVNSTQEKAVIAVTSIKAA